MVDSRARARFVRRGLNNALVVYFIYHHSATSATPPSPLALLATFLLSHAVLAASGTRSYPSAHPLPSPRAAAALGVGRSTYAARTAA